MTRSHSISEKHPIVSMLLSSFIAVLATVAVSAIFPKGGVLENLATGVAALAVLLVFWWWFSPRFKGDFKPRATAKEVGLLFVPFIAFCVLAAVLSWVDAGFYFKPTTLAVTMGTSAGFAEETWFRGLAVPIGMGFLSREKRVFSTVLITSIFFGVLHFGNVFMGAEVSVGILQAVATTFGGIFFIAVFLRSGSVLVPIFMHGFYDWVCFVTDPTLVSGVIMVDGITLGLWLALALHVALGCIGIYLVRPAMHGKINAIWDQIWAVDTQ